MTFKALLEAMPAMVSKPEKKETCLARREAGHSIEKPSEGANHFGDRLLRAFQHSVSSKAHRQTQSRPEPRDDELEQVDDAPI